MAADNTVDIATIEAVKENIVPLAQGRSAHQLSTLFSHARTGLESKLEREHQRFARELRAVELYEKNGSWSVEDDELPATKGKLAAPTDEENNNTANLTASFSEPLTPDQVAQLAEDPLDIHHRYVRFIINSYPAGPSSQSRLVPLLEASTRKFARDARYTNDPRYLRLWNLYAKNTDAAEDCYRFLFSRNIGASLAMLYEEYALVLEAAHK